jgi:hypothetical protein
MYEAVVRVDDFKANDVTLVKSGEISNQARGADVGLLKSQRIGGGRWLIKLPKLLKANFGATANDLSRSS